GLRASRNAINRGIAVRASVTLWIVSARSATDPDSIATTNWIAAVTRRAARDIHVARVPSRVAMSAASGGPKCSWPGSSVVGSPRTGSAGDLPELRHHLLGVEQRSPPVRDRPVGRDQVQPRLGEVTLMEQPLSCRLVDLLLVVVRPDLDVDVVGVLRAG